MENTINLTWQIDLEFICKLSRTWLWDENKPYKQCEELLLSILETNKLSQQEQKDIALQILEGKKIIRGINTGYLEDDGELIRPISTLIEKYQKKSDISELENDILYNPWKYIDIFAGGFSIYDKCAMDQINTKYKSYSIDELIMWRKYGQKGIWDKSIGECNDPLEAGTQLLSNIGFAIKVLEKPCKNNDEVALKLTNYYNEILINLKNKGIDFKDMNDYEKRLYERNVFACKSYNLVFPYNNPYGKSDLNSNGLDYNIFNQQKKIEEELSRYKNLNNVDKCEHKKIRSSEKGWYTYIGESDKKTPEYNGKYFDKYGWINDAGKWYSCGFGGHNVKAKMIIKNDNELNEKFKQYYENFKNNYGMDCYDGFLESLGWIKFHNPMPGEEPYPEICNGLQLTCYQKEIIIDIQKQFKLNIYGDNFINFESDDKW